MMLNARSKNAADTSTLISAIETLRTYDFGKMMGSGIIISLTSITQDHHICDEFMIAAEDMENIKPYIIRSLETYLERQRISLISEVKSIDDVLGEIG